ncbi:unnamed protein product [Amoebophrya sp. A25]|nr:unnamed protein product [Amoebophrya sp. A25]|eukprot:GSA25T00000710001.1
MRMRRQCQTASVNEATRDCEDKKNCVVLFSRTSKPRHPTLSYPILSYLALLPKAVPKKHEALGSHWNHKNNRFSHRAHSFVLYDFWFAFAVVEARRDRVRPMKDGTPSLYFSVTRIKKKIKMIMSIFCRRGSA